MAGIILGAGFVTGSSFNAPLSISYNSLTSGRGLIAFISYQDGGSDTLTAPTCTGESNLTLIGTVARNAGLGFTTQMAYLSAQVTSGNKTLGFNWSGSGTIYAIIQEVYFGSNGGILLDGSGNAQGLSGAPFVNVTTGSPDSGLFGMIEINDFSVAIGGAYTFLTGYDAGYFGPKEYNLDAGAPGTYAVNWTATSGSFSLAAAGFKPSIAIPSQPVFRPKILSQALNRGNY